MGAIITPGIVGSVFLSLLFVIYEVLALWLILGRRKVHVMSALVVATTMFIVSWTLLSQLTDALMIPTVRYWKLQDRLVMSDLSDSGIALKVVVFGMSSAVAAFLLLDSVSYVDSKPKRPLMIVAATAAAVGIVLGTFVCPALVALSIDNPDVPPVTTGRMHARYPEILHMVVGACGLTLCALAVLSYLSAKGIPVRIHLLSNLRLLAVLCVLGASVGPLTLIGHPAEQLMSFLTGLVLVAGLYLLSILLVRTFEASPRET